MRSHSLIQRTDEPGGKARIALLPRLCRIWAIKVPRKTKEKTT